MALSFRKKVFRMGLLFNQRGLCFGVANHRSLAWAIAKAAHREQATVGLVCQNERTYKFAEPLANDISAPCFTCDVNDESMLKETFRKAAEAFDGLDFVVHSIAFAPPSALTDEVSQIPRDDFKTTFECSVYSLLALADCAKTYMKDGGSICTLTYIGSQFTVPGYGLMGPAKSALEACVRSLACELGSQMIRVNAVSAGPVKTLASSAIKGLRSQIAKLPEQTPIHRELTHEDVADAVLFLLSPLSRAITGEVIHCDNGFHCAPCGLL